MKEFDELARAWRRLLDETLVPPLLAAERAINRHPLVTYLVVVPILFLAWMAFVAWAVTS